MVPKQEQGIDKDCPERLRLAGIEFTAQRRAAATTTRVTTRRATTTATAFGHEYERIKIPKSVDTVYRIVNTLTGKVGGGGSAALLTKYVGNTTIVYMQSEQQQKSKH